MGWLLLLSVVIVFVCVRVIAPLVQLNLVSGWTVQQWAVHHVDSSKQKNERLVELADFLQTFREMPFDVANESDWRWFTDTRLELGL